MSLSRRKMVKATLEDQDVKDVACGARAQPVMPVMPRHLGAQEILHKGDTESGNDKACRTLAGVVPQADLHEHNARCL